MTLALPAWGVWTTGEWNTASSASIAASTAGSLPPSI